MNPSIRTRILKNIFSATFAQVISIIIQITLIPIYLRCWGQESLGQWFIIQSLTNWLFISDLGILGAHATELTLLISKEKWREATVLFKSTAWTTGFLSLFSIFLFTLLSSSSALWKTLGLENTNENLILITFLLSTHNFLMQRTGLLHDVLRAHGKMSEGTHWNSFFRMVEFIASATIALLGGKMLLVALGLVLVRSVGWAVMSYSLRKAYPWLNLQEPIQIKKLKEMLMPSFSYLLFPLADRIKFDGTSLILGSLYGPALVSSFNTLRTLSNTVFQASALFRTSVLPEFSIALAQHRVARAKTAFLQCLAISFGVTFLASIGLLQFGAPIYEFWTHKSIQFDPALLKLFLMGVICHTIWSNAALPSLSVNRQLPISIALVLSCSLSLALSALLSFSLSLHAFGVGFLLNELFMIPIALKESQKILDFKKEDFYISTKKLLASWKSGFLEA